MEKHITSSESAAQIWKWLNTRGGIAIWRSLDLSGLGESWTTPARTVSGEPMGKPTWKSANAPDRIITDPAEVVVSVDKEVKRFRVAVRFGRQGMSLKVTDAGSERIRREVVRAGAGAYHRFDYSTQEAIIMAPEGEPVPIAEYMQGRLSQVAG